MSDRTTHALACIIRRGRRRTASIDQLGLQTDYEYDAQGRLTAVVLPFVDDPENAGQQVPPRYEYEYDTYGNHTLIRDNVAQLANGTVRYDHDGDQSDDDRETTFEYDHLGRQTKRTLPMGQSETFSYDDDQGGVEAEHVDLEGRITRFTYGFVAGSRRMTVTSFWNDGDDPDVDDPRETVTYSYDARGSTRLLVDANAAAVAERDACGNAVCPAGPCRLD